MDKITPPPMPEQAFWGLDMHGFIVSGVSNEAKKFGASPGCETPLFTASQLTARDALWLAIVTPLLERLEKAEMDAGRYRWLRAQHWVEPEATFRLGLPETEFSNEYNAALDAAIDAAMAQEDQP